MNTKDTLSRVRSSGLWDRRKVLAALGGAAVLGQAGVSRAQQAGGGGGLDKWRIGTPVFKADSMFQNMALEKGFFKEEGIDAEIVGLESSATITRAVISGELEMGSCGSSSPIVAIARGGNLRVIGSIFARVPHLMYANKEIKSPSDLEGKNVGGAQPGALLQQLAFASLREAGVDVESVQFVNTGGSPATFQAVVSGLVDAGVAGSEYALNLKADPSIPVHMLYSVAEKLPNFLRNVDFVSTATLTDKRDLTIRAVRAYLRGVLYALENKDETVEWAVAHSGVKKEIAEAVWEEYVHGGYVNKDYAISPAQISYTQDINVETGVQPSVVAFDDMVDASIAEEVSAQP